MARITRGNSGNGTVNDRTTRPTTRERRIVRKPQQLPDNCAVDAITIVRLPDGSRGYRHCDGQVYPYPEFETPLFDTETGEYVVPPGTKTNVNEWQVNRLRALLEPYLPIVYGLIAIVLGWQLIKLVYKSDL